MSTSLQLRAFLNVNELTSIGEMSEFGAPFEGSKEHRSVLRSYAAYLDVCEIRASRDAQDYLAREMSLSSVKQSGRTGPEAICRWTVDTSAAEVIISSSWTWYRLLSE
jgi:hypothetical protein